MRTSKRDPLVPFWMLLLGGLPLWAGVRYLFQWDAIGFGLKTYTVLSLLAGAALAGAGLKAMRGALPRAVALGGVGASLVLGLNQSLGMLTSVVPCYGPG
jgi:hypothetical protein